MAGASDTELNDTSAVPEFSGTLDRDDFGAIEQARPTVNQLLEADQLYAEHDPAEWADMRGPLDHPDDDVSDVDGQG